MKNVKKNSVAIHQPDYIPWIGYFYKMAMVDKFVFLDAVQYPRGRRFANRNRIKTSNGVRFLTVPVSIIPGRDGKITYNEVRTAGDKWKKKHLKTIKFNYSKAPYFNTIYPMIENIILKNQSFVEMNIALIKTIADYLRIKTPILRLSNILEEFGRKNYLIIDICRELGAESYYSGTGGGKEYNDEKLLAEHGITLKYSDFKHPVYPQLWGEFESRMTVLDLLFNCGSQSRSYMLGN